MLELTMSGLRHDSDLQLVQADVRLTVDGELLLDESVCIDAGLPALLNSALRDTEPNRWASPEEWERIPFFVCGCGDPDCRAFSLVVRHKDGFVWLTEVEERQGAPYRVLSEYQVPEREYQDTVLQAGRTFLAFIEGRDYRPLFADTLPVIRRLLQELEQK